jgi:hypothetical protein
MLVKQVPADYNNLAPDGSEIWYFLIFSKFGAVSAKHLTKKGL